MTTQSIANRIRAAREIRLSAIGVSLIILGALWITLVYLTDIPRMIAAGIADYIGILAQ
jgi:hypothetical protein